MLCIKVIRPDGSEVTYRPPFLPGLLRRFPRLLRRCRARTLPLVARKPRRVP